MHLFACYSTSLVQSNEFVLGSFHLGRLKLPFWVKFSLWVILVLWVKFNPTKLKINLARLNFSRLGEIYLAVLKYSHCSIFLVGERQLNARKKKEFVNLQLGLDLQLMINIHDANTKTVQVYF